MNPYASNDPSSQRQTPCPYCGADTRGRFYKGVCPSCPETTAKAPPMTPPTCATCRWFDDAGRKYLDTQMAPCRRYPPAPSPNGRRTTQDFAWVTPFDWCGEHAPRGEA